MDAKTLFGWTVIPAACLAGMVGACLSKRIRDLFFILLVTLSPLIERLDLNFVSREWYRGTSRGFEFSVMDILAVSLLFSALIAPRRSESRAYWPASLGWMLLFFCYACFNVYGSDPQLFGLFELFRMVRGFILVLAVAFYLRSERELRLFLFCVATIIGYEGLLVLKQRYLNGIHRVAGTVDESNSLSVLLVTITPVMVTALNARLPKMLKVLCAAVIPLAMVAEIMTISRAGVIIMGLLLLSATLATISFQITARKVVLTLLVCLGVTGILAKSWKTLGARFQESTLKEEYGSNKKNLGRGYYLRIARAIAKVEFFGVGLNNWSYWVSNKYGPKNGYRFVPYRGPDHEPSDLIPSDSNVDEAQAAPAHNLGALTLGELGIPGLALFTLVWLRWFQMGGSFLFKRDPDPMQRIAVGIFFGFCGMFLQCLTEWVFRHLPLYYVFHEMLGVLMSLYYLRRLSLKRAAYEHQGPEQMDSPARWVEADPPVEPEEARPMTPVAKCQAISGWLERDCLSQSKSTTDGVLPNSQAPRPTWVAAAETAALRRWTPSCA